LAWDSDNECYLYLPQVISNVFRDKGEVYRYINSFRVVPNVIELSKAIEELKIAINDFVKRIEKTVQCIIVVKTCYGGFSIAIVFDGGKKVFYALLNSLYSTNNLDYVVNSVLSFLNCSANMCCLKELKAIYIVNGEKLSFGFRCLFDVFMAKAVILNAILLAFFIANIQILRE